MTSGSKSFLTQDSFRIYFKASVSGGSLYSVSFLMEVAAVRNFNIKCLRLAAVLNSQPFSENLILFWEGEWK